MILRSVSAGRFQPHRVLEEARIDGTDPTQIQLGPYQRSGLLPASSRGGGDVQPLNLIRVLLFLK